MFWGALRKLIYLFQLSLENGVFPDNLKIAKAVDSSDISKYRLISVLPCFSQILERLNIICEKQFGFQTVYSTKDAIIQLVDKTFDSFEKEQFTLWFIINLPKTFDTVDHSILLKKIETLWHNRQKSCLVWKFLI